MKCCVHFNNYSSCYVQNLGFVSDILRVFTNEICAKKWITKLCVFYYGLRHPRIRTLVGAVEFLLSIPVHPDWSPVQRVLGLGVKWPWHGNDHSPAPSAKVKNGQSCTFAPLSVLPLACCEVRFALN
jgi:hypothetical protein